MVDKSPATALRKTKSSLWDFPQDLLLHYIDLLRLNILYQAQPTVQKSTDAVPEKGTEDAEIDTNVDVDVKLPILKPDPVPDTVLPPPLATITSANPQPQTALTPLIGNFPPQAVESLKVAAQEAASILPLQPTQVLQEVHLSRMFWTGYCFSRVVLVELVADLIHVMDIFLQELLEQQASIRTTTLDQPVDQGIAPMEE